VSNAQAIILLIEVGIIALASALTIIGVKR
jgi:hypothetical protein